MMIINLIQILKKRANFNTPLFDTNNYKNMKHSHFPYVAERRVKSVLKPANLKDAEDEINIDKNAWISDGVLKPTELGLPIFGTIPPALDPTQPSPMDNMVNILVNRPYAKDFNKMYHALAERVPDFDIMDPDTRSYAEKQFILQNSKDPADLSNENEIRIKLPNTSNKPSTRVVTKTKSSLDAGRTIVKGKKREREKPKYTTVIPGDAHLQTFGGIIPYFNSQIFADDINPDDEKNDDSDKRVTGIEGERIPIKDNQASLIRELHFSTTTKEEVEQAKVDDSPFNPISLKVPAREGLVGLYKMPKTDNTCKKCLKKYFDPTVGRSFIPKDAEKDFPMDMFVPEKKKNQPRASLLSDQIVTSAIEANIVPQDIDPNPTVLSTKGSDILFTRDNTPFTRNDIAEMRAFEKHWETLTKKQMANGKKIMAQRDKMVRETFQSQKAFENYLRLLDEDCQRVESGLLGKSKFKKHSIWEIAVKTAEYDPTALRPRREFWWRLGTFCKYKGGCSDPIEEKYILTVRKLLMDRHAVDKSLFWDALAQLPNAVLENIQALTMIEFSRITLDVDQIEFDSYIIKRNASRELYIQIVVNATSREVNERMNAIAKGPISVPDPD